MSWGMVAVAAGTAIAGAVSAKQGAKAANKSKTSQTDQTTTQNPYAADRINPDIDAVLEYQRGVVQRGAPQVDRHGNVYYSPMPGVGDSTASVQAAATGRPSRSGGGGGGSGSGGTWTNAKGQLMTTGPGGKPIAATAGGPPGAGAGGGAPAGPNLSTPQGIYGEVARRGLDAGNTATQSQARNVMSNIWGGAAGQGSTATGERTGFEGYNPILDRLTGTLEGDVNSRVGRDLLRGFLDENGRGGGGGATSGSANGGGLTAPNGTRISSSGGGNFGGGRPIGPDNPFNPNGNGSGVPDTMVPESYFGAQTRKVFDEQANDAELQALIDSMNEDTERGMYQDLTQLDAAAQGTGRFGGDMWKGVSRDAREEGLQEMLKTSSQVRVGDRESRRQAKLASLGLVNQRDLGLLNANVQREGIAAGERSAGAGYAASAAAQADQLALAKRGQDLSAIGALLDTEQFSLGQLGDVGGQLSGDRLASLGMVPGLEGIGLSGLNSALGAGGGLTDLRGQDVQRQIAGQQAGIARQGMNQQMGMFNASQQQGQVNDYLRTILGIGGLGGTSHTEGTNVQPGLGVSPSGAALQGALGGAATGAGLYSMYRGY